VPDSTSSNHYFVALQALVVRYHELKPRHPSAVLFFRLGVFYHTFGEDATLLALVAGIRLKFTAEELAIAEIPVLNCETAIDGIARRGLGIIIVDEGVQ
jgi:DNA mismatch repair protein MutS